MSWSPGRELALPRGRKSDVRAQHAIQAVIGDLFDVFFYGDGGNRGGFYQGYVAFGHTAI